MILRASNTCATVWILTQSNRHVPHFLRLLSSIKLRLRRCNSRVSSDKHLCDCCYALLVLIAFRFYGGEAYHVWSVCRTMEYLQRTCHLFGGEPKSSHKIVELFTSMVKFDGILIFHRASMLSGYRKSSLSSHTGFFAVDRCRHILLKSWNGTHSNRND